MCSQNKASLEVSYSHLAEMQSLLAMWLTDVPKDLLAVLDEVLRAVVLEQYPHYLKVGQNYDALTIDILKVNLYIRLYIICIDRQGAACEDHRLSTSRQAQGSPPV